MVSQWPVEIDDGGQRAQTPCGFPARIAAAIVIVAALVLVDGSKEMAPESQRTEQDRPSACGADAVARAQRGFPPRFGRSLIAGDGGQNKGHASVAFFSLPSFTANAC